MIETATLTSLWLFLAAILHIGFCSQLSEHDNSVGDKVFKNLPLAECDMIMVSSEPLLGEANIHMLQFQKTHYRNHW